jgi:hypothetical protein
MVFLAGCGAHRTAIKRPLKEAGAHYLIDQLNENELEFEWFSAKYSAEQIYNKKKTSFKGQVRIARDSLIWISVSPALGIEMARLLISTDTVKMLNRFEDNYFISDFGYINQLLNHALDFDMLQAFITGNDFSFYEDGKFKATVDDDEYKLMTMGRHKLKKYVRENEKGNIIPIQNIWLDPESYKITRVVIKEIVDENRKFEASYSEFELYEDQLFPKKASFNIESYDNKMTLTVDFGKVTIDEPLRFPYKVPEKYEQVYLGYD